MSDNVALLATTQLLSLLLSRDCYAEVQKNQAKFRVLATRGGSNGLDYYWKYLKTYKMSPPAPIRKALEEFISNQEKGDPEQTREEFDAAETLPPPVDFNVMLDEAHTDADNRYQAVVMTTAKQIAVGRQDEFLDKVLYREFGRDKEKWPPHKERAERYIRNKFANNPFKDNGGDKGGVYQDNTGSVTRRLLEVYATPDGGGLLTGFPSVDDNVVIGTGFQHLRFIGIAGQAKRGKTMTLLTIAYNLAKAGKNVLYNSLEHSYEDTWALMAFLHGSYFSDQGRFTIPPLRSWTQRKATKVDFDNLAIIQEDAQKRIGLPGAIDACQYNRWDDIVARVESNYKTIPYDVVIVDYIEGLEDAQSKYRQDDEYIKLMKRAQRFTREFNGGKGMVVMTPLTINKEGAKQADGVDPETPEIPFGITAVRGASQVAYDMDLILGVHSTPDEKDKNTLRMWGIAMRHGVEPPLTMLRVDPRTKHVRDTRGQVRHNEDFQARHVDIIAEEL
jgi:KaiC/GvpD/RAD55 family RecA-like ATPase